MKIEVDSQAGSQGDVRGEGQLKVWARRAGWAGVALAEVFLRISRDRDREFAVPMPASGARPAECRLARPLCAKRPLDLRTRVHLWHCPSESPAPKGPGALDG